MPIQRSANITTMNSVLIISVEANARRIIIRTPIPPRTLHLTFLLLERNLSCCLTLMKPHSIDVCSVWISLPVFYKVFREPPTSKYRRLVGYGVVNVIQCRIGRYNEYCKTWTIAKSILIGPGRSSTSSECYQMRNMQRSRTMIRKE